MNNFPLINEIRNEIFHSICELCWWWLVVLNSGFKVAQDLFFHYVFDFECIFVCFFFISFVIPWKCHVCQRCVNSRAKSKNFQVNFFLAIITFKKWCRRKQIYFTMQFWLDCPTFTSWCIKFIIKNTSYMCCAVLCGFCWFILLTICDILGIH